MTRDMLALAAHRTRARDDVRRLEAIHPGDTYAGPFVEATELRYESGDYDRADHSQYLRGDSLVTAFAGTTVEVSAVVQGVRFLIDVEQGDD